MNKKLQEKVAKAMYDCVPTGDCPPWEEAERTTREWLISRAEAAIEAIHHDLKQFVDRNLKGEAATIGDMLIERLQG